ncbi:hypothetical protein HPC49_07980 [Pyxidicoccus fallax]|uniref:DUF7710 domain-containing protein n=1 Tax=Pyxidicoccus fallax TaxID=394095 RepID=A0A848LBN8_9BACT|nr:hypothetical protein [Pyxidicoccus fallax]NMO14245.1 hypothetical protein [Pyxidicoccus fallax]NPC78191.1 hypothetical protein [Pyxidicoccus fallax]
MRRLRFPYVMPYSQHDWVVSFAASRETLAPLGTAGFIEEDPTRTASGREFYWAFERDDGLRFDVVWYEPIESAVVRADPPDANQAIAALRSLGVDADFEQRQLPDEFQPKLRHARAAVWVFTGKGATQPTAVFSRKQSADKWLAKTGYSGVLVAYPLDSSLHEFERNFGSQGLPPPNSPEAQAFVGTLGERYEYVDGRQVPEKAGCLVQPR